MKTLFSKLHQRLFRLGPDSDLPVVLTQRRIFILPAATGVLFAVLLAVMLLGAINYNLGLGHALVFLLAGLGIVGMLHTFRNLANLRLFPLRAEAVFAGETARFPVRLENRRHHARRSVELCFADHEGIRADVPAQGEVLLAIPFPTTKRGSLDPGRITLSSRYPLGLFRAWSYPHPPLSCLVYPAPIESPLPLPVSAAQAGAHQGSGGYEDFSGLRHFQPNDSPRHIAWKAFARNTENNPLLVKQFTGGSVSELWLDWEMTTEIPDSETRFSILSGWILAADRLQIRYGLRLPGDVVAPGHGPIHRDQCLEALALHGHR